MASPYDGPQPRPTRKLTSLNPLTNTFIGATPDDTVSIKVPRSSLGSYNDTGLAKTGFLSRHVSTPLRKRVYVEAAHCGTNDSIYFAPDTPSATKTNQRETPTEYVKICPKDHDDVVCIDDDFEIEFVGMSVTRQDTFGGNDLLLCSLTREEEAAGMNILPKPRPAASALSPGSPTTSFGTDSDPSINPSDVTTPASSVDEVEDAVNTKHTSTNAQRANVTRGLPRKKSVKYADDDPMNNMPDNLRINPSDIPFIHYDPIYDGHDVGSKPDTYVPMPGSKRLYLQRKGRLADKDSQEDLLVLYIRFTVMEVDKLSEEQLEAIRSIDSIARSVQNAAASVPYLKIVSGMLKFANHIGKSALKKVSKPDHVMSADIGFKLHRPATDEDDENPRPRQEEFGNYLRYGYYFFLSRKVDARLYAQTGSSSQSVSLLLRRHGYNPWMVGRNEKEFFPLTGVSYVAIKVARGCSPLRKDRRDEVDKHRRRLLELLQKYKGTEEESGTN
eukprot:GFKZ01008135.1.p1 GENE.GFKZ01008135.1~~GFKZ01008135.1.p1  ORF type:complete len:501 (-),score=60.16 GFKZ01008135.1:656-2158(-)